MSDTGNESRETPGLTPIGRQLADEVKAAIKTGDAERANQAFADTENDYEKRGDTPYASRDQKIDTALKTANEELKNSK